MLEESASAKYIKSSLSVLTAKQYNKRIQDENRIRLQRELERRNTISTFVAEWQDNAAYAGWKDMMKRMKYKTANEIAQANQELLYVRREELKALFEKNLIMYENELHQRGLAFHRNRI